MEATGEEEGEDDDDENNSSDFNKAFFMRLLKLSKIVFDIFETATIILFVVTFSIYAGIFFHFMSLLISLTPFSVIQYLLGRSFKQNELNAIRKPLKESLMRRTDRYRLTSLGLLNVVVALSFVSVALSIVEPEPSKLSQLVFMTSVIIIALRKFVASTLSWIRVSHTVFVNEKYLKLLINRQI